MTTTRTRSAAPPRRSALEPATAMRLAATEYGRYLDQLRSLDAADWTRPTDCPAWDVRAMAGHCLGMAEFAASVKAMARQNVTASSQETFSTGKERVSIPRTCSRPGPPRRK